MNNKFTQFLFSFTLLAIIVGSGYSIMRVFAQGPCATTTTYTIGSIDPRFGIATSTVAAYLKQASNVWNSAYPTTTLLSYASSHADIVVTFVYDERQRTTIRNERLKQTIGQEKDNLSQIKETIQSLREEYTTLQTSIETRTANYTSELAKHNSEVSYWNTQGGAPNDVYQRLQREAATLETERVAINGDISRFNDLAEKIRQYGKDHNEMVSTINEKIDTLNQTAMRDFEEGTYDPSTRTITIYEYDSDNSLKRVLIHEFGHSLGLDHVNDEDAIMYPVNQGKNLTLTVADKNELARRCAQGGLDRILAIRDGIVRLAISSWLDITAQRE